MAVYFIWPEYLLRKNKNVNFRYCYIGVYYWYTKGRRKNSFKLLNVSTLTLRRRSSDLMHHMVTSDLLNEFLSQNRISIQEECRLKISIIPLNIPLFQSNHTSRYKMYKIWISGTWSLAKSILVVTPTLNSSWWVVKASESLQIVCRSYQDKDGFFGI